MCQETFGVEKKHQEMSNIIFFWPVKRYVERISSITKIIITVNNRHELCGDKIEGNPAKLNACGAGSHSPGISP